MWLCCGRFGLQPDLTLVYNQEINLKQLFFNDLKFVKGLVIYFLLSDQKLII